MIKLDKLKIKDHLFSPLNKDKEILDISEAFDGELKPIYEEALISLILAGIETLEDADLDKLAWQFRVMFYDSAYTLETKRKLIENSINYNKKLGTPWMMEEVLTTTWGDTDIDEWFNYGGKPYFFRVIFDRFLRGPEDYKKILEVVYKTKNVRSWLEEILFKRESQHNIFYGINGSTEQIRKIKGLYDRDFDSTHDIFYGINGSTKQLRNIKGLYDRGLDSTYNVFYGVSGSTEQFRHLNTRVNHDFSSGFYLQGRVVAEYQQIRSVKTNSNTNLNTVLNGAYALVVEYTRTLTIGMNI